MHQYDNAQRLNEIRDDATLRGLVSDLVVDLLNEIGPLASNKAAELEKATDTDIQFCWTNDGIAGFEPEDSGKGLCRRVGSVLILSELQKALNHEIAVRAAWAINQGDSRNSVAKAMGRNPSNLYHKRNDMGDDIARMLAAYEQMDEHPHDSRYAAIDVKLHDGYTYTAQRINWQE